MLLAALAACWTVFDVPQEPGRGHVFIHLHVQSRGDALTLSWSDGPLNVLTGAPRALAPSAGLPDVPRGTSTVASIVPGHALLMNDFEDRLELYSQIDGGWQLAAPVPRRPSKGEHVSLHALAELPDGGLVTAWAQKSIASDRARLEAALFAGGRWSPLSTPATEPKQLVAAGTWVAWASPRGVQAARVDGPRLSPVAPLSGKPGPDDLALAVVGDAPVVGWLERDAPALYRWSGTKWVRLEPPRATGPLLELALAGTPDGALFAGWTQRDAQGQFVAMIERRADGGWERIADGLQLDDGDNHVDHLAFSATSRDELWVALAEQRRDRRVSLVRLHTCAEGETAAPYPVSKPPESLWPKTVDEAAALIVRELDEPSKVTVRKTARKELIGFHMGWGMGIRNRFGLWRGNTALLESCKAPHPDSCSSVIIERVWELLQAADGG